MGDPEAAHPHLSKTSSTTAAIAAEADAHQLRRVLRVQSPRQCDNISMPKQPPISSSMQQQINILDVRLLDLFAQLEAIMRRARDVQRAAIYLREAAQRNTPDAKSATSIRGGIRSLARESRALDTVVRSVSEAADDLPTQARLRRGSHGTTHRRLHGGARRTRTEAADE